MVSHEKPRRVPFSLFWKVSKGYMSLTGLLFFVPGLAYLGELDFGFKLNNTMWMWLSILFTLMGLAILFFNLRKILDLYNLLNDGNITKAVLVEVFESGAKKQKDKIYKLVFQYEYEGYSYSFSENTNKLELKIGQHYLTVFIPEQFEEARVVRFISPKLEEIWLNN